MRQKLFPLLIISAFLQILLTSSNAQAQTTETTLILIASTADRICGVVRDSGSATSTAAKGVVKTELRGLANQLGTAGVTAGVEGSGGIATDEYQNVLREQLPAVLESNSKCKLRVFELLQFKLVPGYVSPTVAIANAPRVLPSVPADFSCQNDRITGWLDKHGLYGNRTFDITVYDDKIIWTVNGKSSRKTLTDIAKEEDIFRRLYPVQRYTPKTSSARMVGGLCVVSQDVEGYKTSSTGKVELGTFRFGFTIRNDATGAHIVERQTDVLR